MNAAETYARHRADIDRMIDSLQMELENSHAIAATDGKNWDRVYELKYVRAQLIDALAFISCKTEAGIVDYLYESRCDTATVTVATNGDPGQSADPDVYEPNA